MKIKRTLPPAAAPIGFSDIVSGLKAMMNPIEETSRFESEIKTYFGVRHCFVVSSGKASLTLILKALHKKHPSKDQVLIPAFTCYSVPAAIKKAGLKIMLCDIAPGSLDFNYEQLQEKISDPKNSILAIVPTHLFGVPSNIPRVKQLAAGKDISIVEDAAQAMGGKLDGFKLGTIGDAGFFSLGRGKAFSTIDGGIILTNNDTIAENITEQLALIQGGSKADTIKIMVHAFILAIFLNPRVFWFPGNLPFLKLGMTFYEPQFSIKKMPAFQLGLTRGWQKKLTRFNGFRIKNSKFWSYFFRKNFTNGSFQPIRLLPKTNTLSIRYPILVKDEYIKPILFKSAELGLGISATYPDAINNITALADTFKGETYPMAGKMAKQLITLPVHSFVTPKDRSAIKRMLLKIFLDDQVK